MKNNHAKVFISSGQRDGEKDISIRISRKLEKLGFDPYIAVNEQTLRGLKENIFKEIETSEYFIFIDFIREKIINGSTTEHRGSLFSHQELALASYLDLPIIALQEVGVKKLDGLIGFLQTNSINFTSRKNLPGLVIRNVNKRGWSSCWKNQLSINIDNENYVDTNVFENNNPSDKRIPCRFFHLTVYNEHYSKLAINCYAYIEKIFKLPNREPVPFEGAEIKWKGYPYPNATIAPRSKRKFDAFWVVKSDPSKLRFNIITDYSGNNIVIDEPGEFEIVYAVISEDFPIVRENIIISSSNILANIGMKVPK